MYKFLIPALLSASLASAQSIDRLHNKQALPPSLSFPSKPSPQDKWKQLKLLLQAQNHAGMGEDSANEKKLKDLMSQSESLASAWRGQFSHKTSDGSSVYTLPKDRMSCLVADKSKLEKMPIGSFETTAVSDPIPNGFPRVQVIPSGDKNR